MNILEMWLRLENIAQFTVSGTQVSSSGYSSLDYCYKMS